VCEARDRKGLYARARSGQLTGMTGVDDPYEEPTDAQLVIDAGRVPADEAIGEVLGYLSEQGWINPRN
jgi:sulfate adenylyltransferase